LDNRLWKVGGSTKFGRWAGSGAVGVDVGMYIDIVVIPERVFLLLLLSFSKMHSVSGQNHDGCPVSRRTRRSRSEYLPGGSRADVGLVPSRGAARVWN
jgi:hypothetical protein